VIRAILKEYGVRTKDPAQASALMLGSNTSVVPRGNVTMKKQYMVWFVEFLALVAAIEFVIRASRFAYNRWRNRGVK
jgi:hypothetical protein